MTLLVVVAAGLGATVLTGQFVWFLLALVITAVTLSARDDRERRERDRASDVYRNGW